MAVVRARTAPPYGLIAFVALWVIATVFAILFYVKWSQTDKELQDANRAFKEIASKTEISTIGSAIKNESSDKASTALKIAQNEIDAMKTMLVGSKTVPFSEVEGQIQTALRGAGVSEKESAKSAIASLAADRDGKNKLYADLKKQFDDISVQISTATSQQRDNVQRLQKDLETLRGQLTAANENLAKAEAARNEAVAKGQSDLDTLNAKNEDARRQTVLEAERSKNQIAELTQEVKDLQIKLGNLRPGNKVAVGEPDGTVLRVSPTNGEVYINLTRTADHVVPGLTFTVYDPRLGVRYGTNEAPNLGKGSIEVIEPGTTSSLCRITKAVEGESIQVGDLIANPVYHNSKLRKTRFVISGDFDLDGDGVATADERERLVRLITSWGGIVEDKVSTQTDYVVMGTRPAAPSLPVGDEGATTTPGSTVDERTKQQQAYEALTADASRLSIPILNATRFFAMIGYNSTTIVRY
jgi:hypothetical protein